MTISSFFKKTVTTNQLIVVVALFLMMFANTSFFSNIVEVYPVNLRNIGFLISLSWVSGCFTLLLLGLTCFKYTIKPIIIALLMTTSITTYFMDSYNIVIDASMIDNIVQTDRAEIYDLLSFSLLMHVAFLGVLPSVLIYLANLSYGTARREIVVRIALIGLIVVSSIAVVLPFSNFYTSFLREHKRLRFYSNPGFYLVSLAEHVSQSFGPKSAEPLTVASYAYIPASDEEQELIIFVVGETARADRFSLNGYEKNTNPLLQKEDVVNFNNFWSCGTSTAVSLPCMFSSDGASDFDKKRSKSKENLLDILERVGVSVLWRDNNSSSKGVADRVSYQSFRSPEVNSVYDIEARDVGMLNGLQQYIDEHREGDILIVLHQMGNHGPAYYKRYPPEFEKFTPACKSNHLEKCDQQEIDNAYDNAILYTDYFLSKVIDILKQNDEHFETVMFYVSDHGESLGEFGLYLHGLPNLIAPDCQRHVPAIFWFGDKFDTNFKAAAKKRRENEYSHDNVFHTILGLMEVETPLYDKDLDILSGAGQEYPPKVTSG